MDKTYDNRAWLFVIPVFVIVAFSAIIPLMTVVNYSVQDIFGPGQAFFVGTEWFEQVLGDGRLHDALLRQFIFSGCVLLIQIPLGIAVALCMPRGSGWRLSLTLVLLALPLLIPWNVVGTIWQIFGRADIGLGGAVVQALGVDSPSTGESAIRSAKARARGGATRSITPRRPTPPTTGICPRSRLSTIPTSRLSSST